MYHSFPTRRSSDLNRVQIEIIEMLRAAVHLLQQFSAANHFIQAAEAKTGEDFADFLGDEGHEVDDLFRGSSELGTQPLVLHTAAHRTGVAMALAPHVPTNRPERKRA